jgi:hypothetical protein
MSLVEEEYDLLPSIATSIVCESAFIVRGVFPVIEKLMPERQKVSTRILYNHGGQPVKANDSDPGVSVLVKNLGYAVVPPYQRIGSGSTTGTAR